mmetsp:Transcript_17141/g.24233  ORF Transcript_17141/g.24233 Transcript_17141/m.24233 type:complete len:243 (+) Transcript_17141:61-789(+)|eukprot:CAMPEP_0184864066 /NCGR_PEP_ID=MMETSP0580-20130426/13568_1 /TAXON_ID=1118495 /ORGANISM="Dactyliosolen fragilissimus" /LENGTH=242 /DNA_ID=CAMNT_0027362697 /DNA_START=40 /DNA_END=768 /DNA_ORIENTATION=+
MMKNAVPPEILWSAVCRNEIILAEAGEDHHEGAVVSLAQNLVNKKPTAGWEFARSRKHGLRGIKLHVYEECVNNHDVMLSAPKASNRIIWSFTAVSTSSLPDIQTKSYLEKLVYVTEPQRESEQQWRQGGLLQCQSTFAPILKHLMEEVTNRGKVAMVQENVNGVKEIMADNIEKMLERGDKLEDLQESTENLNEISKQFKKKAKQIKKFKAWQNAKYGLVLGTAVTGGIAIVTIPPLIALL